MRVWDLVYGARTLIWISSLSVDGGRGRRIESCFDLFGRRIFRLSSDLGHGTAVIRAARRRQPEGPAIVIISGTFILLPLSPALIFGWGPFPNMGVAGGGVAVVVYYLIAALALVSYLRSGRSTLRLKVVRLEGRLFSEILGVGLLSAIGTVQVNLTVVFVTASVGHFGIDALAGYGIASRLDYLQIPVIFGIGTAIVTMVGLNIGAGQVERARRIAWLGAALAFGFSAAVGIMATAWPRLWMRIFTGSPDVVEQGNLYLTTVAPFYPVVAFGLALYFASQGAKRVLLPVLAGTMRMVIAAFIGWATVAWLGADLSTLYAIVALSAIVYGILSTVAVSWGKWEEVDLLGPRSRKIRYAEDGPSKNTPGIVG